MCRRNGLAEVGLVQRIDAQRSGRRPCGGSSSYPLPSVATTASGRVLSRGHREAADAITHVGGRLKFGSRWLVARSASAIMLIVFWRRFVPWGNETEPPKTSCAWRYRSPSTRPSRNGPRDRDPIRNANATPRTARGATGSAPRPYSSHCTQSTPPADSAAPTIPSIRAWLDSRLGRRTT